MDYKIFVIEHVGFGDEFFIMLMRPKMMRMTDSDALWDNDAVY